MADKLVGTERENKLIDIMFQLVLTARNWKDFNNKSTEEIADWITDQLNACGFPTIPIGATWGRLVSEEYFNEYNKRKNEQNG